VTSGERGAPARADIARSVRRWLPWALALAAYAGSRVFYASLGLEMDASSLGWFWQYLDVEELRANLLEAVYYQHTQPPLYNLYLGLGLKLSDPQRFFHAGAIAFGLALHLGLFALMCRLRVRAWLALGVTALFAFSPASILMELWLFYTYPVAALVVAGAVLFHRALDRERPAALAAALFVLALVPLSRSLFHVGWMLVTGDAVLTREHYEAGRLYEQVSDLERVELSQLLPGERGIDAWDETQMEHFHADES